MFKFIEVVAICVHNSIGIKETNTNP